MLQCQQIKFLVDRFLQWLNFKKLKIEKKQLALKRATNSAEKLTRFFNASNAKINKLKKEI